MSDSPRQAPLLAMRLLVFAAIEIVLALVLLVTGGLSIQFFVFAAIGLALAGVGMRSVFSRAAVARTQAGDAGPRPLPWLLRPRRRRGRPRP